MSQWACYWNVISYSYGENIFLYIAGNIIIKRRSELHLILLIDVQHNYNPSWYRDLCIQIPLGILSPVGNFDRPYHPNNTVDRLYEYILMKNSQITLSVIMKTLGALYLMINMKSNWYYDPPWIVDTKLVRHHSPRACWLSLVAVDNIRDMLRQVTKLPSCSAIVLGRCTNTNCCVYITIG